MAVSFAFIGFGEAGSEVSAGLLDNGVERIQMHDILLDDSEERERTLARATEIGVKACDSIAEAVFGVDIIFFSCIHLQSHPSVPSSQLHLSACHFELCVVSSSYARSAPV